MFVERPTGSFEFRRGFALKDGEKVLLVEDDAALSGYLAASLRSHGFSVQTASDRARALACLDKPTPPALILLDLVETARVCSVQQIRRV